MRSTARVRSTAPRSTRPRARRGSTRPPQPRARTSIMRSRPTSPPRARCACRARRPSWWATRCSTARSATTRSRKRSPRRARIARLELERDIRAAEAVGGVVVDDACRLHPRIDDRRPDELEAARLECFRYRLRQGRLGGEVKAVADQRHAVGEGPAEGREILARVAHREEGAGAADRRLDLGTRADDAGIAEQPHDVRLAEARHRLGIEAREGGAERLALAQHGDPGEPRLEAVEHQLLPQRAGVELGHTPFGVMVGTHHRIVPGPAAALVARCVDGHGDPPRFSARALAAVALRRRRRDWPSASPPCAAPRYRWRPQYA